jgi:hypothetical protein
MLKIHGTELPCVTREEIFSYYQAARLTAKLRQGFATVNPSCATDQRNFCHSMPVRLLPERNTLKTAGIQFAQEDQVTKQALWKFAI